jgi:hypothetical protein
LAGIDVSTKPEDAVIRFRFAPNKIYTYASRFHPIALNTKGVIVRRLA